MDCFTVGLVLKLSDGMHRLFVGGVRTYIHIHTLTLMLGHTQPCIHAHTHIYAERRERKKEKEIETNMHTQATYKSHIVLTRTRRRLQISHSSIHIPSLSPITNTTTRRFHRNGKQNSFRILSPRFITRKFTSRTATHGSR